MEVLEAAVCGDYVVVHRQCACLGQQRLFLGEIFLEVVVAEFLVYLEVVGILLAGFLEAFPECCFLCGVDFADCVELVLQLAVAGEGAVDVVGVFGQCGNPGDYVVLPCQVGGTFFLQFRSPCRLARAEFGNGCVELLAKCGLAVVVGLDFGLFVGRGGVVAGRSGDGCVFAMEHAEFLAQAVYVVRGELRRFFLKQLEDRLQQRLFGDNRMFGMLLPLVVVLLLLFERLCL